MQLKIPVFKQQKSPINWAFHGTYLLYIPILVEEGGFEPPKRKATDLQSAPFGHSGTLPYSIYKTYLSIKWSWWTDSNPRPADYKSAALPTELHQLVLLDLSN